MSFIQLLLPLTYLSNKTNSEINTGMIYWLNYSLFRFHQFVHCCIFFCSGIQFSIPWCMSCLLGFPQPLVISQSFSVLHDLCTDWSVIVEGTSKVFLKFLHSSHPHINHLLSISDLGSILSSTNFQVLFYVLIISYLDLLKYLLLESLSKHLYVFTS